MLALSMVVIGCGSDEGTRREGVAVQNQKESSSARVIQSPPPIKTAPASIEPAETVASEPELPKKVTYEEAETAFHDKNYDQAMELFTLYTDRKSENPWGYYMLGLSAWKAGDHGSAEEAFERALELDQCHVKSWLNLGRVLLDTDRPEEALAKIDEALAIDPESNVAYRLQGRAFHQLGQKEEAIGAYRRAIQIDDQDAWSMNNLGLMFLEEGRFDEALPPLARATELRGDAAIFLNNLGMALECTGHFRAAEEAYKSAITVDESYEKAHNNLERIEAVHENPGIVPVDLEAIARSFVDEINGWSEAAVESEQPESVELGAGTIVVVDTAVVGDTVVVSETAVPCDTVVVSDAGSSDNNPEQ
jgi:tetratricopeptide (TPR) repeat protein